MDAQTLVLALCVGALTGYVHVATLGFGLGLAMRGRILAGAALNLLRFAAVAAALSAVARLGAAALETAAAALIVSRMLAIRDKRGAA